MAALAVAATLQNTKQAIIFHMKEALGYNGRNFFICSLSFAQRESSYFPYLFSAPHEMSLTLIAIWALALSLNAKCRFHWRCMGFATKRAFTIYARSICKCRKSNIFVCFVCIQFFLNCLLLPHTYTPCLVCSIFALYQFFCVLFIHLRCAVSRTRRLFLAFYVFRLFSLCCVYFSTSSSFTLRGNFFIFHFFTFLKSSLLFRLLFHSIFRVVYFLSIVLNLWLNTCYTQLQRHVETAMQTHFEFFYSN